MRGGQREYHPERPYFGLLPSSFVLMSPSSSSFVGPGHFVHFTVHRVASPPWPLPCPALPGEPATARVTEFFFTPQGRVEGQEAVTGWSCGSDEKHSS